MWFDLEPFDGGAQQVLRGWGFFALRPAHVPDENGSGVVTVQCATLERLLALAAALVGVRLLFGFEFEGLHLLTTYY